MDTNIKPGPQHEMATDIVSVPTVVNREIRFEGKKVQSIFIQWFGEADSPHMPKDAQFFFETEAGPDNPVWMERPSSFRVIFIGRIKDWVNPNAIDQMIEATKGSLETNIVWLMSPKGVMPGYPSSPMMKLILLGDPVCGLIKPRLYSDLSVKEEVIKAAEAEMTLADKLLRDPRMELPAEEIPWNNNLGTCSNCRSFENSHTGAPALPSGGDYHDLSYICRSCGRRWWQYNDYYHLWKHVTSRAEWDSIRRQQILKDAGYELLEK